MSFNSPRNGQPTRRALLAAPLLRRLLRAQNVQDDWQDVKRVVAVGDVHGDCDALSAVLKMAGLVDDHADWTGGDSHLVQVGDIPARGPQTRKAMDLMMKLESQAGAAGGHVHALIGNHEAMIMYGNYQQIISEEFAEFRTPRSEETLKAVFDQDVAEKKQLGTLPRGAKNFEEFKRQWFEYHVPGFAEYKEAFGPNSQYGKWIRSHNVVIRVNDTLYSHGGISPEFLSKPIATINKTIQTELADPSKLPPGMTTNFECPLWYRGLIEEDEHEMAPHVQKVLQTFGVKRIVVGHSVTRSAILPRFNSAVIDVDIGLSKFFGRPPACLVLEKGEAYVLHRGVKIPVPGGSKDELFAYLRAVAAADNDPEVIQKLIDRVKSAFLSPLHASPLGSCLS
jgi:hypothetical protein